MHIRHRCWWYNLYLVQFDNALALIATIQKLDYVQWTSSWMLDEVVFSSVSLVLNGVWLLHRESVTTMIVCAVNEVREIFEENTKFLCIEESKKFRWQQLQLLWSNRHQLIVCHFTVPFFHSHKSLVLYLFIFALGNMKSRSKQNKYFFHKLLGDDDRLVVQWDMWIRKSLNTEKSSIHVAFLSFFFFVLLLFGSALLLWKKKEEENVQFGDYVEDFVVVVAVRRRRHRRCCRCRST